MNKETWYVLENGDVVDPQKCEPDDSGHLAFDGVKVARRGDVYHSRSVEVNAEPKPRAKEAKPAASKPAYKTRESKAD